jgi:YidC/Oxa1 family membrane protein insertase
MQLQWSIENLGSKPIEVCYQLQGPLGTPSETWWYQNKIHARTWAIGYIAGARDVIGSTAQEEFTFFGGPEMVGNAIKPQPKYFWLLRPPVDKNESTQQVRFLSVDTQYFNVALLPEKNGEPFSAYSVLADVTQDKLPKEVKKQKLVDCTFQMFKVVAVGASQKYQQSFEIFAGPKEPAILAQYGLDGVRSFGWFAWFSIPLCWLLEMFHTITFKLGYGIPIILLTVLVRCLMIPISRKAAINAQMMQHLAPQMKEIADKYKDDMEKRGQAQRDLFRKYRYNPFGGCFMMFLQIPIFIGLYRGLSVEIALRDQPLFPGLGWCTNLAAPDQLWYWKDWFPGFMSFLTDETGWLGPYLNILPIITCVLFVVQQKMFTPPPTDEQQEMMHKVMKYMTIFMGFLFFKVPSGLCLYFITSSVWGIIERKMLPKPELDKERLHQLESAGNTAPSVLNKLQLKQRAKAEQAQQKRDAAFEERKRLDRLRKKRLRNRDA